MKRTIQMGMTLMTVLALMGCSAPAENEGASQIQAETAENPNAAIRVSAEEEHYIFALSDQVERIKVYYPNRFGIELAGDLYLAKDADLTQ